MLEKKVRKSLIETKERKEKLLIEEKLIKNRLSMVFEGIKSEKQFKELSEEKKLKLSVKFIQEVSYLMESGIINEDVDFGGLLKSIFGNAFGGVAQTMVEPLINSVLSSIGFGDGFIKNFLISYLTSRPSDVIKSFSDCNLMAKLVGQGIVEAMVMTMQRKSGYGGFGYDLIRNTLGSVLESSEFISGIEKGLAGTICSVIGKFTNNTKEVANKLKSGVTTTTNTAVA
jgi:hypothetical protein